MSPAAIGFYGSKAPFFAMPPMFLSGTALAGAGFAWINSIGNLGGTAGPYCVAYMKDLTGNFAGSPYGLALLSLIAAIVCAFFLHRPSEPECPHSKGGGREGRQVRRRPTIRGCHSR
jgi:ACS family tartrate transporter-like MFS transporter